VQVEVRIRSVGRSLLTHQGLVGVRRKFSRDRPFTSELSIGILSPSASYRGVSLDRYNEVSAHTFPQIRYPWNTLRLKLQRYPCACRFISFVAKIPNKISGTVTEKDCCIYLRTLWSSYISFFFVSTFPYPWRSHPFTTSPPQLMSSMIH
jgi:hypothetical protein